MNGKQKVTYMINVYSDLNLFQSDGKDGAYNYIDKSKSGYDKSHSGNGYGGRRYDRDYDRDYDYKGLIF